MFAGQGGGVADNISFVILNFLQRAANQSVSRVDARDTLNRPPECSRRRRISLY